MKASELLRDQQKVIKNFLPDALKTIRDTTTSCMQSPVAEFVDMGRELAAKEAMFMALGGFQVYFDMMDLMVRIVETAEKLEEDQRNV